MKKQTETVQTRSAEQLIVIDAKGKTLGRLASEVAHLLQGKDKITYVPYKDEGHAVDIKNFREIKVTGSKWAKKLYWHFSGYPGGIRARSLKEVWQKNPADVLHRAVYGMLPKNKLRNERMKRLSITL